MKFTYVGMRTGLAGPISQGKKFPFCKISNRQKSMQVQFKDSYIIDKSLVQDPCYYTIVYGYMHM